MRNLTLLALLIATTLPRALGSSIDYIGSGSIGAGTAQLTGNATAANVITLNTPLVAIGSTSTKGRVISTGTLTATQNANVFDFRGGSITIASGTATLFHGALSSGTVTILGKDFFSINATGRNGGAFTTLTDRHGDVVADAIITPEPGGLALLGTGVFGLAGLICRKRR